ncbi:hypothetical protein C8T65DRAFT_668180 [Cerioporus squamosus]|nr:hypothetical protein C8T65DRAFT_668180 [Cerioporus squamosus]
MRLRGFHQSLHLDGGSESSRVRLLHRFEYSTRRKDCKQQWEFSPSGHLLFLKEPDISQSEGVHLASEIFRDASNITSLALDNVEAFDSVHLRAVLANMARLTCITLNDVEQGTHGDILSDVTAPLTTVHLSMSMPDAVDSPAADPCPMLRIPSAKLENLALQRVRLCAQSGHFPTNYHLAEGVHTLVTLFPAIRELSLSSAYLDAELQRTLTWQGGPLLHLRLTCCGGGTGPGSSHMARCPCSST